MLLLGEKNRMIGWQLELFLLKGMRQRLAFVLLTTAEQQQSMVFDLDWNRNELAELLNVSRTSMCRELARMKQSGMIDFYKQTFRIQKEAELRMALAGLQKIIGDTAF